MNWLKQWGFVPLSCIIGFFAFLLAAAWLQTHIEGKGGPEWSPSGDPRDTMSHGDALLCWCYHQGEDRSTEGKVDKVDLVVTWMPGATRDHVFLYPSSYGQCGILPVSQFNLNPVNAHILLADTSEPHRLCVTTWSPSHKQEPDPPYMWTMTELTEDKAGHWVTFVPNSSNHPRPVVEINAE